MHEHKLVQADHEHKVVKLCHSPAIHLHIQAWKEITSRIEKAMRQLENDSPSNKSQLPKVAVDGESLKEVAPKLPGKNE